MAHHTNLFGSASTVADAQRNLPNVLNFLTTVSLESTACLVQDGEAPDLQDIILAEHFKDIQKVCAQLEVGSKHLNPKYNKAYGPVGRGKRKSTERRVK